MRHFENAYNCVGVDDDISQSQSVLQKIEASKEVQVSNTMLCSYFSTSDITSDAGLGPGHLTGN